jgi:NAD(P)-dependent dehydrogenase (short-subunit alcohol dehydrogenase family)
MAEVRMTAGGAALVTGASSGIGYAIAEALAEDGFGVTMSARPGPRLRAAVEGLAGRGLDVHEAAGDVRREDDIKSVIRSHQDRYGRLDVLVNNAGIVDGYPVGEFPTDSIDEHLSVNLRAAILFYRHAVSLLRATAAEHGTALVANTSSCSGKRGEPWLSVYSTTKAGIIKLTESMNMELGKDGIKSTALCPSWTATPMAEHVISVLPADEPVPGEMLSTRDLAEAVRFLLRTSPACLVPELVLQVRGLNEL